MNNHTISKEDIHKICRICLIITENTSSNNFTENLNKLQYCIGIKLEEDVTLPSIFCNNCTNTINIMYNFKELCLYSQQMLSDIVRNGLENVKSEVLTDDNYGIDNSDVLASTSDVEKDFDDDIPPQSPPITPTPDTTEKTKKREQTTKKKKKRQIKVENKTKTNEPIIKEDSENPLECRTCQKSFKSWRTKKAHMKNMHLPKDERLNYCTMCSKGYIRLEKLIEHQKSHDKPKKVSPKEQCNICGKTVASVHSHIMKVHSNNRPYQCSKCDSKFAFKWDLGTHINRVHNDRKKKYLCTQCGKIFRDRGALREHLNHHEGKKPYKCTECNFETTWKVTLIKHVDTHNVNRVKKFSCTYCDKKFSTGNLLRSHIRSHTGERPYACKLCDKRYTQRSSLRLHLRSHQLEQKVKTEISQ